ncbi:hypothetical protein GCM10027299_09460 [Larkinella ripae]
MEALKESRIEELKKEQDFIGQELAEVNKKIEGLVNEMLIKAQLAYLIPGDRIENLREGVKLLDKAISICQNEDQMNRLTSLKAEYEGLIDIGIKREG